MEYKARITNIVGYYAAILAITEVGLGTFLHALQLPFFVGFTLSLNQIFLLNRASFEAGIGASRVLPGSISCIGALLKSLAPFGKKLMPMVGISMQGLMFSVGTLLFGHSRLARLVGSFFASLWSFIQVITVYYLLFGLSFFMALGKLYDKVTGWIPISLPSIEMVVIGIISLKVVLALLTVFFAERLSSTALEAYCSKMKQITKKAPPVAPIKQSLKVSARLALKDICMLPFLLCVFISSMGLYLVDPNDTAWIIYIIRPLALGFLCFFIVRIIPIDRFCAWLEAKNLKSISGPLEVAVERMRAL